MTSATRVLSLAVVALAAVPVVARAQNATNGPRPGTDSVVVQASQKYGASGVHRFLLGSNYRDLWYKPIRVPVLNLQQYAGGLTALEEGGNAQTRNLHLRGADGKRYVFRPVFKEILELPENFRGTLVADLFADGLSASHPAATVLPNAFLKAAGVLASEPKLYVMPDDEKLAEFRKNFAGKLGTMEEFPEDPEDGDRGFGGAVDIINSDDLLERLNEDPANRIDARALLTARLIDLLIGDNDRHPGQWKWARMTESEDSPWIPVPRDRDKAFVSYEGLLLKAARLPLPRLVTYRTVPKAASFYNAVNFDRRLLVSLNRATFDSTARFLQRVITDSVIDAAIRSMPKEYQAVTSDLAARIKARRNTLPVSAEGYYRGLFEIVDLHGSDAPDKATITRRADGSTDVTLQSKGVTYFNRGFDPSDTKEIRLYLHAGADSATVLGEAPRSIPLWIVGGADTNVLADSSVVGGRRGTTRLYDNGGQPNANLVVRAGDVAIPKKDSGARKDSDEDMTGAYDADTAWNRRPVVKFQGWEVPPFRDRGTSLRPSVSLKTGRGLGFMPILRLTRRKYGFRQFPYASNAELKVGYSTELSGWEVEFETDNRFESSRLFYTTLIGASQLKTGRFGGFGNDIEPPGDKNDVLVNQQQLYVQPSLGWAITPTTDLTLGPVAKYTRTDSTPNRIVSELRPYGFQPFGQAGFTVRLLHESARKVVRYAGTAAELVSDDPHAEFALDVNGAVYPAMWDVRSAFGTLSAVGIAKFTIPVPLSPVFALRVGGQQNFGEYPFFEAAFLGGRGSIRTLRRQQLAGDAALFGTAELRIPIARFPFILPMNTGVFGFADAARVYLDGESPGGWHTGLGGGLWIGVLKPSTGLSVTFTNNRARRTLFGVGFAF